MALFGKHAQLRQIQFDVTVLKADERNPALNVTMRSVPGSRYTQMTNEWNVRDREDFAKSSSDPRKMGEQLAEFALVYENGLVCMTGLTLGNYARLGVDIDIDDDDRKRFFAAGDEGVRLTKDEFIGLCF